MEKSTIQDLISKAPALLKGELSEFPTRVERRALQVLEILKDGKWHIPSEIAVLIGVSKKYVSDILRAVEKPWNLETKREGRDKEKYWRITRE